METIKIQIKVIYEKPGLRGENDFKTLQELKRWLDKHPEFAEKLGYVKK